MSEGEWPPPTTFTRLFCCLARASTCQGSAWVSLSSGLCLWHSQGTQGRAGRAPHWPPGPLPGWRLLCSSLQEESWREGPGSEWDGEPRKHPEVGLSCAPLAGGFSTGKPDHIPQGKPFQGCPGAFTIRSRLLTLAHTGLSCLPGWNGASEGSDSGLV